MTAIVGTINRRGVAFAADSAATHTVSSKHKITNHANKIFERGIEQFKRNLRFVNFYPSEVLWSPMWKLWHYYWRKREILHSRLEKLI